MSAPKWAVGMQRLMPGVYVKDRQLHLDLDELCETNGVPATPENYRMLEQVAREELRGMIGERDVPITLKMEEP